MHLIPTTPSSLASERDVEQLRRWKDGEDQVRGWSYHPPSGERLLIHFRGGTRHWGRLTAPNALAIGRIYASHGLATFMPEYPERDEHGSVADRQFVLETWRAFSALHPHLDPIGSYGHSRGCMQSWMLHLDAKLGHLPLAFDCPVADLRTWPAMRPNIAGLFAEIGITPAQLESRSMAAHLDDVERAASRLLIQVADDDQRVRTEDAVHLHQALVARGYPATLSRYPGGHCFPEKETKEASLNEALAFLRGEGVRKS